MTPARAPGRAALVRLAAAAALAAATLAHAAPAGAEDPAEALEEIRRAIEDRRERLDAYDREERGLFETLQEMDEAASQLERRTAAARRDADAARRELARVEAEAAALAAKRERLAGAMAARAVALYKAGAPGPVRLLFAASDLRDLLSRVRTLRVLLDHDRELLVRFRRETAALEATRARSREVSAERDRAERLLRARARELRSERAARARLLTRVREDRARERTALNELEAAALALEETLAALQRAPRRRAPPAPGTGFAALRGRLPAPVERARIARGYGRVVDEQFRTATFRKGVDFEVEAGEPVAAVADGEVRFAGWFRGYGKMLILDHGDGYFTICAHLAALEREVGDQVEAGDPVGRAGDTGSLSGPLLYFEIRRGAEPLDPAEWLDPQTAG